MKPPDAVVEKYRVAARRYRPADRIRVLFIAESPPFVRPGGWPSYFFFEDSASELLFATVIYALYGVEYRKDPAKKAELLRRLQFNGYWLIDVAEHPINDVPAKKRPAVLREHVPSLLSRLAELKRDGVLHDSTGLALIKKDVWSTVEPVLSEKGYRVLNRAAPIGFPGYHRDQRTVKAIRETLRCGTLDA